MDKPVTRKDLIGYSSFVYMLGFFSAAVIVLGRWTVNIIIAMAFAVLMVIVGFIVIDDALSSKNRKKSG